ncbi:class I SAM-dependent methyltransferase [Patescibacteria group bacterium]|nr:class I SAM-dependent methyltransferase [Patescibacteria group bacterium]
MEPYKNREEKAKWIVHQFDSIFKEIGSVLDIGCDEKHLEKILSKKIKYVGIDNFGKPDISFDLDKKEGLPFKKNNFDLVFCADVLEHLENIHFVFDELCRISKKYIIISLPNPFLGIFTILLGKKYSIVTEKQKEFGKYLKFYGLPLERPKDRHRWFFNNEESVDFVRYRSEKNKCKILKIIYTIDFQGNFKKLLKLILSGFNRKKALNWFNGTTWFLIRKSS